MNSLARLEIRTKWQEMQNKQDQLKDIGKIQNQIPNRTFKMQGKFIELTPLVTSPATSSAVKRNINILFAEALKGCPHSFSSSSSS